MKHILIFAIMLVVQRNALLGQNIELKNLILTNQPNRNIVYAGIENRFKITSVHKIEKITSAGARVIVYSDTLKIYPIRLGKIDISIKTGDGMQVFSFETYRVPELFVAITEDSNSNVSKYNVLDFDRIELRGRKDVSGLVTNYKIESWEAQLNDKTFTISGDHFSDAFRKAIGECTPGTLIIIGNIQAYNPINSQRILISQKKFQSFTIISDDHRYL